MSPIPLSAAFTVLPVPSVLGLFASSEPVPGGGSAAAITGSLAASLGTMVASLTQHKPGYEEVTDEVRGLRIAASGYQDMLLRAAELDMSVFEAVTRAYQLPKATDEEKASRSASIQLALKGATRVPLETAQSCLAAGRVALKLLAVGSKNASSDAATGVLLALAGAESALLNVAINLGSIKDEAFVKENQAAADACWAEAAKLREELWPAVKAAGLSIPR